MQNESRQATQGSWTAKLYTNEGPCQCLIIVWQRPGLTKFSSGCCHLESMSAIFMRCVVFAEQDIGIIRDVSCLEDKPRGF